MAVVFIWALDCLPAGRQASPSLTLGIAKTKVVLTMTKFSTKWLRKLFFYYIIYYYVQQKRIDFKI